MCGIFAIYSNKTIPITNLFNILNELKHRGKDSYGISYIKDKSIETLKLLNLPEITTYNNCNIKIAVTHNRYSTNKNKKNVNFINQIQPIEFKNKYLEFVLAHNGNIANIQKYTQYNYDYYSDTQNIMKFFTNASPDNFEDKLIEFVNTVHCSYSIIKLYNNVLYALRDRYGYKPLILGQLNNDYCISSESCITNFNKIRDVNPGEIIKICNNKYNTIYQKNTTVITKCIFEYIYFMNEHSTFNNHNVFNIRKNLGTQLAFQEKFRFNKKDTIVIGSPNTAIPMGKGYAKELNLEYKQLLIKHKNTGRTFILKDQESRIDACKKFIIDKDSIKNKIIILVDDSLVRGNTINSLSQMFHDSGCLELHIRICSPELKNPCFYGIDIPTKEELIINNYTINEIEKKSNLTSLRYISLDSMIGAFNNDTNFCTACFTGNYNKELEW